MLAAVLLCGSVAPIAAAGTNVWTRSGLAGESVVTLAIDPTAPRTLYAATSNGVFKSTDAGTNWQPSTAGLPAKAVGH